MGPDYSRKEWLADAVIHGLGVAAAPVAVIVLLYEVIAAAGALALAAAGVYGAGLVVTLSLSAAYNLISRPGLKEAIRRFDHAAIFVMIAGTYTPFALVAIGGAIGHALLALVWAVAAAGVWLKLSRPRRLERAAIALYLALGWIGLPALGLLIAVLPARTLVLLGVGGLLYTAGVGFHLWERLPYQNAVWHGLVLAAAACHYVAVLDTLAP